MRVLSETPSRRIGSSVEIKSTLIIRIDDRLVHGQVLVGWATYHSLNRLIVANNAVAASEWETNMIRVNATSKLQIEVLPLSAAELEFGQCLTYTPGTSSKPRNMLLLQSIHDLAALSEMGFRPGAANLGGIHYQPGRVELVPYIFLDGQEKKLLNQLKSDGWSFYCQDIPQKEPIDLPELPEEK